MPRAPHTMPQRPMAVSKIAKLCPVMAGSKSTAPWSELDAGSESRLGNCCDPPEFRGHFGASREINAEGRSFFSSFRGANEGSEPGIHNHDAGLRISGPAPTGASSDVPLHIGA